MIVPYRLQETFWWRGRYWESWNWVLLSNISNYFAVFTMKWVCDHRSESQFKQLRKSPEKKKGFRGFSGIRTRGLCISAAVLYQPELWRPIHWRPANLLSSSTRERNETQKEMMWTAEIQMKWVCGHRSESQFKQLRKSPKKKGFRGFSGIRTRGLCVSAVVLYQPELWRPIHWRPANLLSSSTRERNDYEDPYTGGRPIYWVHQPVKGMKHRKCGMWFKCAVSFLSPVDELNKLAGLQCMGLHSSGW